LFATTGKLLYGRDPQPQTAVLQELAEHLLFMEHQGLQKMSDSGPYWLGKELSLVDLTFYPWFEQIAVLEHYRGFRLPPGLDRLKKWWETLAERESVRSIANSSEFYLERYARLARLSQA
jgi:glutathione S-transferase